MIRNLLQLIPLLILILVSCNFPGPSSASAQTPTPNTNIPSTESTVPIPGDLGFGKIFGKVTDSVTGAPIAGANVKCEHFSYTSREEDRCNRSTTTDENGNFLFEDVFFHDTDTITLTVDAPGYQSTSGKYAPFTLPVLEANIQLSE
jgi:carboxypeptidase family protein